MNMIVERTGLIDFEMASILHRAVTLGMVLTEDRDSRTSTLTCPCGASVIWLTMPLTPHQTSRRMLSFTARHPGRNPHGCDNTKIILGQDQTLPDGVSRPDVPCAD